MTSYFPPGFRTADGVPLGIPSDAAGALTSDEADQSDELNQLKGDA